MYLPIFIIPHEDVIVYSEPGSTDLRKNSHHAVTLHICKAVKLKKNSTKKLYVWWKPLGPSQSIRLVFPEWPKGYGWIAPPAQVAKGLGELHWAPGDLVHWVNPVPGGGSPCPRLQRGTAYLSTQSTTVKSDRSQSQHNIFLYKNKFHHRAVEILFPCIDRKLVNHLYSPPTYAIYKNLWPVLQ